MNATEIEILYRENVLLKCEKGEPLPRDGFYNRCTPNLNTKALLEIKMTERCTCGACLLGSSVTTTERVTAQTTPMYAYCGLTRNPNNHRFRPTVTEQRKRRPGHSVFRWLMTSQHNSDVLFCFFNFFHIHIYTDTMVGGYSGRTQILYIPAPFKTSTEASSFILFTHF